jgi:hypothetical protein
VKKTRQKKRKSLPFRFNGNGSFQRPAGLRSGTQCAAGTNPWPWPSDSGQGCPPRGLIRQVRASVAFGLPAQFRRIGPGLRGLWLAQAETDRRRRAAFRSVGSPAARTEDRDQRFTCIARDGLIGLNGANARGGGVTLFSLVTFFSLGALWPLRSLRAGLALRSWHALNALSPLRSGRTLCAGIALRSRIPAAACQRDDESDRDYWKNPHASPLALHRPIIGGELAVCLQITDVSMALCRSRTLAHAPWRSRHKTAEFGPRPGGRFMAVRHEKGFRVERPTVLGAPLAPSSDPSPQR